MANYWALALREQLSPRFWTSGLVCRKSYLWYICPSPAGMYWVWIFMLEPPLSGKYNELEASSVACGSQLLHAVCLEVGFPGKDRITEGSPTAGEAAHSLSQMSTIAEKLCLRDLLWQSWQQMAPFTFFCTMSLQPSPWNVKSTRLFILGRNRVGCFPGTCLFYDRKDQCISDGD